MVMWLLRLTMRLPRPLARAAKRLSIGAASISMRCTLSSSMSAPRLFSALAMADSRTFSTSSAPFFGMNFREASATPTPLPRTVSATRRHFCGEMRAWRKRAVTCMASLCAGHFAIAGVRLEQPRRRKLAELVTDHVLGDEHRDVLPAVVNRDRETDHVGNHHRAARPGLDRPAIVLLHRDLHLLRQVQIHERTFLQRTRHAYFLRCTIMLLVRLLRRVFLPLVCQPHGDTGCGLPWPDLPSPPPCGWSTGFITTPRTVGRTPSQRTAPALPNTRRLCSSLPTSPMVARASTWILRLSPDFTRTLAS